LKRFANPPFETVIANVLNLQMLDSAAGNLDLLHIRLLPVIFYQKKYPLQILDGNAKG
jgi:hypothetical protein